MITGNGGNGGRLLRILIVGFVVFRWVYDAGVEANRAAAADAPVLTIFQRPQQDSLDVERHPPGEPVQILG